MWPGLGFLTERLHPGAVAHTAFASRFSARMQPVPAWGASVRGGACLGGDGLWGEWGGATAREAAVETPLRDVPSPALGTGWSLHVAEIARRPLATTREPSLDGRANGPADGCGVGTVSRPTGAQGPRRRRGAWRVHTCRSLSATSWSGRGPRPAGGPAQRSCWEGGACVMCSLPGGRAAVTT